MTNHDHDLSKRPEAAGMSGKELLQAMIDGRIPGPAIATTLSFPLVAGGAGLAVFVGAPGPAIAKTLSVRLVEVADGFAVFEGEPGPHVLNPNGMVHGGWALPLIDSATGCAAHSLLPPGSRYATIETKG